MATMTHNAISATAPAVPRRLNAPTATANTMPMLTSKASV